MGTENDSRNSADKREKRNELKEQARIAAAEEQKRITGKTPERLNPHQEEDDALVEAEVAQAEEPVTPTPAQKRHKTIGIYLIALLAAGGFAALLAIGIHKSHDRELKASQEGVENITGSFWDQATPVDDYNGLDNKTARAAKAAKAATGAAGVAVVPVDTTTMDIDGRQTPVIVYLFTYDNAGVSENARLNEMAAVAKKSGGTVYINAYTDEHGSLAYNRKLSQRRADALGKYMADHGVPAQRIKASGNGPTHRYPTDKQNRRAELTVK